MVIIRYLMTLNIITTLYSTNRKAKSSANTIKNQTLRDDVKMTQTIARTTPKTRKEGQMRIKKVKVLSKFTKKSEICQ